MCLGVSSQSVFFHQAHIRDESAHAGVDATSETLNCEIQQDRV